MRPTFSYNCLRQWNKVNWWRYEIGRSVCRCMCVSVRLSVCLRTRIGGDMHSNERLLVKFSAFVNAVSPQKGQAQALSKIGPCHQVYKSNAYIMCSCKTRLGQKRVQSDSNELNCSDALRFISFLSLLHSKSEQHYSLRERIHNFQLPDRTSDIGDKNFIIRMRYIVSLY